ncbi:SCP2 sterol-binding domain-containing protein [Haloarcula litorea]|uniref:SCP2 sterol-binding domain-containing protein n=1 Tax=Haloarcula litorea TaxID=3032579 RepID=UPI0023E7A674|nr:SCP2 sterol-binding domain-containing protein [Halomicroarcula sp. GDY20]
MTHTLPDDAEDWARAWRDRINDREGFATAAAGFEATFLFEIQADGTYDGDPLRFRVVVDDGACTETSVVDGDADYEFALRGEYEAWRAMLGGGLDASEAVMDGTFDVTGNTMTLLRRQEAIGEMVDAARGVDTAFAY